MMECPAQVIEPKERGEAPAVVVLATVLLFLIAAYVVVMSVLLLPVGLFVGPPVFYASLVHTGVAILLIASLKGLSGRRRWARWLAIGLGLLVALLLPIALLLSRSDEGFGIGPALFFSAVAVAFAIASGCLLSRPASRWLTR